MNTANLIGRLTRDPEVNQTSNNVSYCRFTIAVNRAVRDANGDKQADFINCVAWRHSADFIGKYVKKGHQVAITGSIQTGSYEKDGNKVFTTDILVTSVASLEKKEDSGNNNNNSAPDTFNITNVSEDDLPF